MKREELWPAILALTDVLMEKGHLNETDRALFLAPFFDTSDIDSSAGKP